MFCGSRHSSALLVNKHLLNHRDLCELGGVHCSSPCFSMKRPGMGLCGAGGLGEAVALPLHFPFSSTARWQEAAKIQARPCLGAELRRRLSPAFPGVHIFEEKKKLKED